MDNRKILRRAALLPFCVASLSAAGLAHSGEVLFSSTLDDLSGFETFGMVRANDPGARLLGGWFFDGRMQTPPIKVQGYRQLELTYERSVAGLDRGEAGVAAYSVDGGTFVPLERVGEGSGDDAGGNPIGVPLDEPMDYSRTVSVTAQTMPPRSPDNCDEACATEITDYLKVTYWGGDISDPGDGGENPDEPEGPILGEGAEPVGQCEDPVALESEIVSSGLGYNLSNTRHADSQIHSGNGRRGATTGLHIGGHVGMAESQLVQPWTMPARSSPVTVCC